jgi:hypothetical protein
MNRNGSRRLQVALAATAVVTAYCQVAFAVDESVTGDLSNLPASPTPVTISVGNNQLKGSVNNAGDTRDYITFEIPTGKYLAALKLQSYGTNTGFHSINLGSTSEIPAPGGNFLGGEHLFTGLPAGTDILPDLATTPAVGPGFSGLGPGTYTYLVQQTSNVPTPYEITIVIGTAAAAFNAWMIWLAWLLTGAMGFLALTRGAVWARSRSPMV